MIMLLYITLLTIVKQKEGEFPPLKRNTTVNLSLRHLQYIFHIYDGTRQSFSTVRVQLEV